MSLTPPLFRWTGAYWGFVAESQLYDRYGRHVGWLEPTPETTPAIRTRGVAGGASGAAQPDDESASAQAAAVGMDVYQRTGRFMGELHDGHYVLRHALRSEPIHRAPRPAVPYPTPPAPPPDREPRDPVDDWSDALPWPLPPPEPPRV